LIENLLISAARLIYHTHLITVIIVATAVWCGNRW